MEITNGEKEGTGTLLQVMGCTWLQNVRNGKQNGGCGRQNVFSL